VRSWRIQDGGWVPCRSLPLEDRGFRYGMSVFETVAVARGRARFLCEHMDRLARAARDCAMPFCPPAPFGFGDLPDGVLRLYVTAGPGAPGDPPDGAIYALFEEAEVGGRFPPLRVMSSPAIFSPRPGGWKTGNYWANVDALNAARRAGCDEAILFNASGAVVGAGMANVFFSIDGEWVTPAREAGARDGVVRAWVLANLSAREEFPDARAVAQCTACFVTNSRVGIRAVAELDARPLATDVAQLQELYCQSF